MKKLNKIFTTADMAVIDRYTIENEPISSIELMERAAQKWTECFLKIYPLSQRIAVIAGNGNNGGDGYAIARLLTDRGKEVEVFRLASEHALSPDCEKNYLLWKEMGGIVKEINDSNKIRFTKDTILIDALFGSGLNRKIEGLAAAVIRKINQTNNRVVAVDIPSGLMGENNQGNDPQAIICADDTITFQFPKLAFMLPSNAYYVGKWQIVDIGLHPAIIDRQPTSWYYLTEEAVAELLPSAPKFAHKGMNGRGVLFAGTHHMMGAAILAAKAAVHSGIGLLYCHVPQADCNLMQISVPEALLDPDVSEWCFSDINTISRCDAVAVGPAIGQGPETVTAMKKLLKEWKGVTILDADALNIMADHRKLLGLLHEYCILTPHFAEFERLAGKCENDFERLNKLSTFASQYRCHVILKGAHTVIASPEGQLYFNMTGNPGMAKGGAGDVLTGVLLALAAGGMPPLHVALTGVFAHGLCGDLLATETGFRGLSAGMMAEGMGKAWKKLEDRKSEYEL